MSHGLFGQQVDAPVRRKAAVAPGHKTSVIHWWVCGGRAHALVCRPGHPDEGEIRCGEYVVGGVPLGGTVDDLNAWAATYRPDTGVEVCSHCKQSGLDPCVIERRAARAKRH